MWMLRMVSGVNIVNVLQYIVKNWRELLILALAAAFTYQNYSNTRFLFGSQTIPALEQELIISQKNLNICANGNAILSGKVDENNTRIREYEALSAILKNTIAELSNEIAENRTKTEAEVDVILNDTTPQTCEKSIDYLRDAAGELKW